MGRNSSEWSRMKLEAKVWKNSSVLAEGESQVLLSEDTRRKKVEVKTTRGKGTIRFVYFVWRKEFLMSMRMAFSQSGWNVKISSF